VPEQRVGRGAAGRAEAEDRDRAAIEPRRGLALWEGGDLDRPALLRRGKARELGEAAEADGDLAVEGIGRGQAPVEVAAQHDGAGRGGRQLGDPGLAVVGIGREHGPGQRADARVRVGGGGRRGGPGRGRVRRCGPHGLAAAGGERGEGEAGGPGGTEEEAAGGGHGRLLLFDIELCR
jgi:hypothetical protein